MRRLLLFVSVLAMSAAPSLAGETTFGREPELTEATPIADILSRPHEFEGEVVQVTGNVTAVCQNMGCWLRVGDADGMVLLARSTGDKITIPTDSAGRDVIVEGVVVLEHEGDPRPEPHGEDHACENAAVRLETRGVTLR